MRRIFGAYCSWSTLLLILLGKTARETATKMNVLSDSESSDSDTGRRFKTESTRAKVSDRDRRRSDDDRGRTKQTDRRRHDNNRNSPVQRRSKSPADRKDGHRRRHHSRSRSRSREPNASRKRRSKERSRSRSRPKDKDKDKRPRDEKHSKHESSSSSREKDRSTHQSASRKGERERSDSKKSHAKTDEKRDKHESHTKAKESRPAKREQSPPDCLGDEQKRLARRSPSKSKETASRPPTVARSEPAEDAGHNNRNDDNATEPSLMCGPSLPPHMLKAQSSQATEAPKSRSPSPAPAPLPAPAPSPPKPTVKVYGPSIPSGFQPAARRSSSPGSPEPAAPFDAAADDISASEEDDFIGPVPVDHDKTEAHLELEKRALELKLAKLNEKERRLDESERAREEWMIELPELRSVAGLGLTARQFRTKERDEIKDRSAWTETPLQRDEKARRGPSTHENQIDEQSRKAEKAHREKRDAEQEAMARKHKKKDKRDQSLMDIHRKKLKKDKNKEPEQTERRPFNRDTDLKANRFDDAQKKAIIKKAQLLDTRFSSGNAKYL